MKKNYIDNAMFRQAIIEYKQALSEVEDGEAVQMSDYLGECFLKLAEGLAKKPSFSGYTYKDDMIADAVENGLRYCYKFDTTKLNPFAYFTQACYHSFLRRIAKEKRQTKIKQDLFEQIALGTENAGMKKAHNEFIKNRQTKVDNTEFMKGKKGA